MKTSWIIGIMMVYLVIFGLEMWVTGGVTVSAPAISNQSTLMTPTVFNSTNIFSSAWAEISHVAEYLQLVLGIFVLWSPTVFSGYLIWMWWGICFPVDVGMVFSVVAMVRGVHSA